MPSDTEIRHHAFWKFTGDRSCSETGENNPCRTEIRKPQAFRFPPEMTASSHAGTMDDRHRGNWGTVRQSGPDTREYPAGTAMKMSIRLIPSSARELRPIAVTPRRKGGGSAGTVPASRARGILRTPRLRPRCGNGGSAAARKMTVPASRTVQRKRHRQVSSPGKA